MNSKNFKKKIKNFKNRKWLFYFRLFIFFSFQGLEEFERQKVADAMEPKKFTDGEMIIKQVTTL